MRRWGVGENGLTRDWRKALAGALMKSYLIHLTFVPQVRGRCQRIPLSCPLSCGSADENVASGANHYYAKTYD